MTIKDFNFDLKQIRSFMEVVNEKSFTNASLNLKISQASISHQISRIEKMLGVKLIHRNSQDFSLTREGEIFLKYCEKLKGDVELLKSELETGTFGGTVSIIASSIPGTYIVPSIVSSLNKDIGGYFYKLEVGNSREAIEKIKQGDADLAIVGREIKHTALSYSEFIKDEIVLAAPDSFNGTVKADDLRKIPMITREGGSGTRNTVESYLNRLGIIPSELNVVMECSSSESMREAVINGIGFAFISLLAITKDLGLKNLRVVKVKGVEIIRPFYIVTSNIRVRHEPSRHFLDYALKYRKLK
jgi:DNA-binding transcriptional LysR family regulator